MSKLLVDEVLYLEEQLEAAKHKTYMAENKAELLAEDIECLHKCLDDLGIPRTDGGGNGYSMWGRVQIAISEAAEAKLRELEMQEPYGWYDTACCQMFFARHERSPTTEIPLYANPFPAPKQVEKIPPQFGLTEATYGALRKE